MMNRLSRMLLVVVCCVNWLVQPAWSQATDFGSKLGGRKPSPSAAAGGFGDSRDVVTVSAATEHATVAPGSDIVIAIVLDHEPGWHTWTNSGNEPTGTTAYADAIRTDVKVKNATNGLVAHATYIQWPQPHKVSANLGDGPQDYAVFMDRAVVLLPVIVASDAPLGKASVTLQVTIQSCDEHTCKGPADVEVSVPLEIVSASTLAASPSSITDPSLFTRFDPSVWTKIHSGVAAPKLVSFDLFGWKFQLDAGGTIGLLLLLLIAALGGLLLNFTPCVLPVIPIKIISLSMSAGNRRRTLALGFAMFLGVIALWVALGLVIATVSGFTATNQLFQYPIVPIALGIFIAIMAIGMCGLFAIRLPQFVYIYNPAHDTMHGSFMFGVMTAILSTPCTAPFMGAAAAWAATQSAIVTLIVFFAIGFGMGTPYFILAAFPKLVERMPRTGPASELIKQVMGLLMLAAAVFFVGVGLSGVLVSPPEPPSRAYWWVVAVFVAMAGGWLAYRTIQITGSNARRLVFGGLGTALIALAIAGGIALTDNGPINWTYYTPQRLADAQQSRKTVVMEFTAEWCLNCKALEKTVLRHPDVARLLAEKDVVPIKVDLTGNNTLGNDMLTKVQRRSIPLLVVFAPDGREVFKGDFYTVNQVLDAVRQAQGKQIAARLTP